MRNDDVTARPRRRRKTLETEVPAGDAATVVEAEVAEVTRVPPEPPAPRAAGAPRSRRGENDREAVLAANAMFYQAFEMRDRELMGQLWANAPHVRCIHPGSEPLCGWDEVQGSWAQIFSGAQTLRFELAEVTVRVSGDLGWVELSEMLEANLDGKVARTQVLATNLFERGTDGRWRVIHHHASPVLVRPAVPRDPSQLH